METSAKKTGVRLIRGYQKLLSPYKGFSCAHRLLHGSESCSQYVKKTLLEQDLRTAIALSRQRFRDCKRAKIVLHSQTIEEKEKPKKRKKEVEQYYPDNSTNGCFDLADCGCGCLDCGSWGNCDNPLPDCGGCDCGDCDCG
ncbi:MAG: membrane protein insertion efficiency factor YidD [Cyanobacteria bacterium P01_E01_bin.42]